MGTTRVVLENDVVEMARRYGFLPVHADPNRRREVAGVGCYV
jgi:hypothetical protein